LNNKDAKARRRFLIKTTGGLFEKRNFVEKVFFFGYKGGMSNIATFRAPIRFLLGDNNSDATLFTYPDASLDAGVQTVIQLGKVKCFKLNPVDPTQITPDIVNPNHFALLCYHTVKAFVDPLPDSYSFKTRAQSERFGHWRAKTGGCSRAG
jgi:hypothetical protein